MPDPTSHIPPDASAGEAGSHHLLACPHCKAVYDTNESMEGKRVRCRVCGHVWREDSLAAEKVADALAGAVSHWSQVGSTLLSAADHASSVGRLVAQTGRDSRPPAGEYVGRRIGRYEVKAIIGQGAMGYVYEALDVELKRTVALKILPIRADHRETLGQKLFLQEARTAARLQHPNIVTVFDVGQTDDTLYLAMELVHGVTLMALVKARGALPVAQACFILAHTARALSVGHAGGVVHRDVKPGNILLNESGLVKLTDFGLADVAGDDGIGVIEGVALGTPGWISPEVARGERATPASDIYGVGLTLYFALTGKRLIKAKTKSAMMEIQKNARSINPADLPSFWPAELRDILARCLAADAADRYQSAEILATELIRIAGTLATASPGDAKTLDIGEKRSSGNWIIAILVLGVMAVAGFFAWKNWF
ncbi:MAG: protein kinase [Planctomycetes bacterium]|nr:protein kinase [Planctomycetota bacterium]